MASRTLADAHNTLHREFLQARATFEDQYPEVEVGISAVHRTPEEQFRLFKVGRYERNQGEWVLDPKSKVQPVTYLDGKNRKSKHNVLPALAVDFYILLHGKVTWEWQWYERLGELCEMNGLAWGGRFKMKDGPHVELPGALPK